MDDSAVIGEGAGGWGGIGQEGGSGHGDDWRGEGELGLAFPGGGGGGEEKVECFGAGGAD